MVTSPPYAVGKDYDEDLSLSEYRKLLRDAWKETRRVLVPGGRVCINVANIGANRISLYILISFRIWSGLVS